MDVVLTALRVLNVVLWGAMMAYMLPGAWTAAFGRVRRGDPMRLACFLTGGVMAGFNLRWLLAPGNEDLWRALYVVSALLAVYILLLGRAYGRGGHV